FLPSDMAPSPVEWGMLLFLGVFQIGIAFSFFTFALKRVLAVEVSLMGTLEPILNPIWVVVGYGEFPTTWAMAGGGIIVGMLIYRTIYLSRRSAIADEEF
ncbi:MAG: EamA family transporter, partial [Bacteroidota bacterium]